MRLNKSFLMLYVCVCFGDKYKTRDNENMDFDVNNSSRDLRGLEDFGFGPCHISGMKYTDRNIR